MSDPGNERRRRVLMLDDNETLVAVMQDLLGDSGYDVTVCLRPSQAVTRLEAEAFDIMVTDNLMPEMLGQDLIAKVRNLAPTMPVIMMTAYGSEQTVTKTFSEGVVDFLVKPVEVERLIRSIERALRLRDETGEFRMDLSVPKRGWVEISAPNHSEFLIRFQTFCDLLYSTSLDEATKLDIKLAVEEMGANAIEWGNARDRNRRIEITFCIFEDCISFRISDQGEGFIPPDLESGSFDPVAAQEEREGQGKRIGGLGLRMVRGVMDEVIYSDRGNVVVLSRRFGDGASRTGAGNG